MSGSASFQEFLRYFNFDDCDANRFAMANGFRIRNDDLLRLYQHMEVLRAELRGDGLKPICDCGGDDYGAHLEGCPALR